MDQKVAGKLITKTGESDQSLLAEVPVVGYYFSAHWCPPCKKFTPLLADFYNKWNANGKKIEIVFVSFDKKEDEYKEYYGSMPWTAIPYGDSRIQELAEKFEVEGIPFLCIVSKDGKEECLSSNGYEDVMLKKEKAIDEWIKLYN